MVIVLFAILGAITNAGTGYWLCFGLYCVFYVSKAILNVLKEM